MVIKAKPRDRPVARSSIRLVSTTVPWAANASCRSFSVTLKERFPTNNFALIYNCCPTDGSLLAPYRSRFSGFKSSLNQVHLKIYHAMELTMHLTDKRTLTVLAGF